MATPSRRTRNQTLYLDVQGAQALDYLREHLPQAAGLKFSAVALFRTMLAELVQDPDLVLGVERHAQRGESRGGFITVTVTPDDAEQIQALQEHYELHAPERRRVRDSAPKKRRLPLSRLFSQFIQQHARNSGWDSD